MARYTQEELNRVAIRRSTKAQAEKLTAYMGAGWRVIKVDGLNGYDAIVVIQLDRTVATVDPLGLVTRSAHKSISYKFPKTTISHDEASAK